MYFDGDSAGSARYSGRLRDVQSRTHVEARARTDRTGGVRAALGRWMLGYTIVAGGVLIAAALCYGIYLLFNWQPYVVAGLGIFLVVGAWMGESFYNLGSEILDKDKKK